MFKNYFKTSLRNLWRFKGFSLLNICGLAIGITCASLIFLWVEDERSYDDYFKNKENIYRVKNHQTYNGTTYTFDATPGPLSREMKEDVQGIRYTARSTWKTEMPFSMGDKSLSAQGMFVDSSFFSIFSFEFVEGNARAAFSNLNSVVLSQSFARSLFGNEMALGKTLKMRNNEPFVVGGVIKDLPENVSVNAKWLAPFANYENQNEWIKEWGNNGLITFAQIAEEANPAVINKQLYNYLDTKGDGLISRLSIYPMTRWRLYNAFENGKEVAGRIKYVRLFSLIAWIILAIACINFMNLSTARSEQRAREVGVRKVLGARKNNLIIQFLIESFLMALTASLFAVALIYIALPYFNMLVQKQLTPGADMPGHWLVLFGIALICGLIAGSYPAFYLSSFQPVRVLKGLKLRRGGSVGFIRKGLVIIQFAISIILIVSTIIIYQQINHVKDRDLGYDKENLMILPLQGNMRKNYSAIRNEFLASGVVENAGLSNNKLLSYASNSGGFEWKGKDPGSDILITVEGVSPEYIPTVGYHLKEGRNFYADGQLDSNHIIINEALAKIIDAENTVGSFVYGSDGEPVLEVVGVVNDFVYSDMYSTGAPMIFFSDTSNTSFMTVRLNAQVETKEAIAKIKAIVSRLNPGYPFEYDFVDEEFDSYFQSEILIGKLASVFAVLAVFISCLGLFGLAAYTAERRTREMGIRKVLGAGTRRLAALLSADFMKLVGVSCLISFPLAWWMLHEWLQEYAYRINISWTVFAGAALLAILIALLTVSYQAIKTALLNPVESIRNE